MNDQHSPMWHVNQRLYWRYMIPYKIAILSWLEVLILHRKADSSTLQDLILCRTKVSTRLAARVESANSRPVLHFLQPSQISGEAHGVRLSTEGFLECDSMNAETPFGTECSSRCVSISAFGTEHLFLNVQIYLKCIGCPSLLDPLGLAFVQNASTSINYIPNYSRQIRQDWY